MGLRNPSKLTVAVLTALGTLALTGAAYYILLAEPPYTPPPPDLARKIAAAVTPTPAPTPPPTPIPTVTPIPTPNWQDNPVATNLVSSISVPVNSTPPPTPGDLTVTHSPKEEVSITENATVSISKIGIGPVLLANMVGKTSMSKETFTWFEVVIRNTSKARKITYRPWCGNRFMITDDEYAAILGDMNDNDYHKAQLNLDMHLAKAIREPVSIYPGQSVTDFLAFEPLIKDSQGFYLAFPARNVEGGEEKGAIFHLDKPD